jgi:tetratricopeptide (TPR) repeat protein
VGLLATAVWAFLRRRAVLALGLLWFLGTLVPVLQFVPIAEPFAERFAYLPSIGLALLGAALLVRLCRFESVLGWGSVGFLATVLLVATAVRNAQWCSPLDLWGGAVEAQPRCARAQLAYAEALKDAGRLREARGAATRALEIWASQPSPLPADRGRALLARALRGGICAELGREEPEYLGEAIADLEKLLASRDTDGSLIGDSPKHAVIHFELAGCYLRRGELPKAEREYRRLVEIGSPPELVTQGYYWRAKLRLLDGDLKAAYRLWRQAVESLPAGDRRRLLYRLELADALVVERKELEKAGELLEEALEEATSGEERAGVLLRQAKLLDLQGQVQAAVYRLEEALQADPGSVAARLSLAGIEVTLKHYRRAEELYEQILRDDPGNQEAARGLEKLKLMEKLSGEEDGEDELGKVLAGLLLKGKEHVREGQLVAARQVYAELAGKAAAAERWETTARAYLGIAGVEEQLMRYEEAAGALSEALKIQPEMPEVLLAAADFQLRRVESRADALAYYRAYLKVLGDAAEAEPRVHLNLAYLLKEKEPEKAVEHFLKVKEGDPRRLLGDRAATVDRELGYLFARLRRWEESLEAFTHFLEAAPVGDPERKRVTEFMSEKVLPELLK